jgi:hypothetical protein
MDPFATTCALAWPPLWAPNGCPLARANTSTRAATPPGKPRRAPRGAQVQSHGAETPANEEGGWTLEAVLISF